MAEECEVGEIDWSASYHSAVKVGKRVTTEYQESRQGLAAVVVVVVVVVVVAVAVVVAISSSSSSIRSSCHPVNGRPCPTLCT